MARSTSIKAPGTVITAAQLISQLRLRHLGMGFYWACSMLTFRTSILLPGATNVPLVSTVLLVFSLAVNIATVLAFAFLEYIKPGFVDRLPTWLFAMFAIAGIALLSAADSTFSGALDFDLFLFGCVFTGISYGYFWVAWAQVYSHQHPDITTIALPLSFIVAVLLLLGVPILMQLSGAPAWVFMVLLPLVSWLLMVRCRKAGEYEAESDVKTNLPQTIYTLRDLLAAVVIFSFLFGFMWESSVLALSSVNDAHRTPSTIALAVAVALFLVTILGRRRWDIDLLFMYGVPVIVVAFALFPLVFSSNTVFVYSVMEGGFSILEILAWVLVATVAYDNRVSGAIVGALVRSAFLFFRVSGIIVAYFIQGLAVKASISPAFFSVLVIVAIWIWLLLVHREREGDEEPTLQTSIVDRYVEGTESIAEDDEAVLTVKHAIRKWAQEFSVSQNQTEKVGQIEQEPLVEAVFYSGELTEGVLASSEASAALADLCYAVSLEHGLSRREAEILPYLALGKNAQTVADELFISENTVRTHIRHILEKTGALSKQDIVDFVYRDGARIIQEKRI